MNVEEFRAQLEMEFEWRVEEINFFQNQYFKAENQKEKDKFLRALILLLYSHFEGFCKFGFIQYIEAINVENIQCSEANYAIVAASIADIFRTLQDGNGKAKEFKNSLPYDIKLHKLARQREFLQCAAEIMTRKVNISEKIINTESNLKLAVLQRNLYVLGLKYNQFDEFESEISTLVNILNAVAHGERKCIQQDIYEKLKKSTLKIMTEVTINLTQAVSEKWFLAST